MYIAGSDGWNEKMNEPVLLRVGSVEATSFAHVEFSVTLYMGYFLAVFLPQYSLLSNHTYLVTVMRQLSIESLGVIA